MTVAMANAGRAVESYTAVVKTGRGDIAELHGLMRRGIRPGNEDTGRDLHLNELIPKPWGYEYRVYADDLLDLWQLCLRPGQRTSMHAHPRKVTYLLCLQGRGRMEGLRAGVELAAGDLVKVDRGAFHQTSNTTPVEDLHLIEVETPRNKFDLIRLADAYNRVGEGYETHSTDLHTVYKRVPYIPGAYMCRESPCAAFGYSVRSGADLHYRGVGPAGFHVPIGVSALLSENLAILRARAPSLGPELETYYLSALPNAR